MGPMIMLLKRCVGRTERGKPPGANSEIICNAPFDATTKVGEGEGERATGDATGRINRQTLQIVGHSSQSVGVVATLLDARKLLTRDARASLEWHGLKFPAAWMLGAAMITLYATVTSGDP